MNSFLFLLSKYKKLGEEVYIFPDINKLCAVVNKKNDHLRTLARKYFKDYYKDQEIKFAFIPKKNCDQLGELVDLTLRNGQQIRYFIKTHRHGSTKNSSSAKDVDMKEVFIYKVLELLGIGEEAHFFMIP